MAVLFIFLLVIEYRLGILFRIRGDLTQGGGVRVYIWRKCDGTYKNRVSSHECLWVWARYL